ncbi:hypothetical protein HY224_00530 [Candidatus Uhrbacteria bacterium]|nr:hypothetical protein [Candidatus Uhrbacteria bacterium]
MFELAINWSFLEEWARLPFYLLFWEIFKSGGWLIFLMVFVRGFAWFWLDQRQDEWERRQKFILLAIDVPKLNEQTPKAVENIFAVIHGAHGTQSWWERWVEGIFQLYFSFEIISIDGYVQFIVWCCAKHRDLIEAAIYAQYPDAEITEIADYTENVPHKYPDPEYKIWGTEYQMTKPDFYPLKSWKEFEHSAAEVFFKDPLSATMEALSSMKVGEQLWIQILVRPTIDSWRLKGDELVKKLVGSDIKDPEKEIWHKLISLPVAFFEGLAATVFPFLAKPVEEKKRDKPRSEMQHLTTGEKLIVEEIERKLGQWTYRCKYRSVYIAKKELYTKARGVALLNGAIKQLSSFSLNGLKPDKKTWCNANYFWKENRINMRRNKIMRGFRNRSSDTGGKLFRLSTEELATLWHFPLKETKVPLLQKTEVKKGEPPRDLPLDMGGLSESPYIPATAQPIPEISETDPRLAAIQGEPTITPTAGPGRGPLTKKGPPPIGLPVEDVSQSSQEDISTPPDNLPTA